MSWLFSQALAEASWGGVSSDGARFAPLSAMPTAHPFSRRGKTIECSTLSLSGQTCEVLTADLGEELLMSFRAGFRAPTSAQQEREPESKAANPASGKKWPGSLAMFDRGTSSWRTPQCSLLADSELFLETWPRWGSMRNGVSYLRPTPALPIYENASGSWPTPTASLGTKGGRVTPRKSREGGTLIEAISARTMWATPMARDWRSGKASQATYDKNSRPLSEQVRFYPTPTVIGLNGGSNSRNALAKSGAPPLHLGQLNPDWVEWLMGWPIGWTALEPLAMDKYHEWRLQHGAL